MSAERKVIPETLSDYVKKSLDARDIQIKRDALEIKEAWVNLSKDLRNHLLQLSAPIDELLDKFRVKETLDEAASLIPQGGNIKKLEPTIYQMIVSKPNTYKIPKDLSTIGFSHPAPRSEDMLNNTTGLGHENLCKRVYAPLSLLLDLQNGSDKLHLLDGVYVTICGHVDTVPDNSHNGYGCALELEKRHILKVYGKEFVSGSTGTYFFRGVDRGKESSGGYNSFWRTDFKVSVTTVGKCTMVVEGIRLTPERSQSLVYYIKEVFNHPQSNEVMTRYLTRPKIFSSAEEFRVLIGDDILKEFLR